MTEKTLAYYKICNVSCYRPLEQGWVFTKLINKFLRQHMFKDIGSIFTIFLMNEIFKTFLVV